MIGSLEFGGETFDRVHLLFEGGDNYARFYRRKFRAHKVLSLEDILILTGCRMEIGEVGMIVRGYRLPSVEVGLRARPDQDYRFQEARFTPGICENRKVKGEKR